MTPEEAAVFAPVAALFKGLSSGDASLIGEALGGAGSAAIYRAGRFLNMSLADLAKRLIEIAAGPDIFDERMDDPLIRIDDNIAVVWGSYTAFKNGVPHHCGSNLISLIHEDGRWRIVSVTDTSRAV